jgi:cathepsin L
VEAAVAFATGTLKPLSRQNMLDCTPNPDQCGGTGGCEGATAELGLTYVQQKGLASESAYPYAVRVFVIFYLFKSLLSWFLNCI